MVSAPTKSWRRRGISLAKHFHPEGTHIQRLGFVHIDGKFQRSEIIGHDRQLPVDELLEHRGFHSCIVAH